MKKESHLGIAGILFLALLSACNLPLTKKITPTPNVTQAYQTVMAQISTMEAAGTAGVTVTAPPDFSKTQAYFLTQAVITPPAGTAKPLPTSQPTQVCDRVLPGNPIDVTIPDDTIVQAGTSFTKTWRLENGGACTWNHEYSIVWVTGEQMSASKSYRLQQTVAPGASIDISLEMTAPASVGTYQSFWMLQNASGQYFGLGPNGKSPFWVKIQVVSAQSATPTITSTATTQPGHSVIYSGVTSLNSNQSIDITSGAVASNQDLDLVFNGNALQPSSSASISTTLNSQPNYNTCNAQSFGSSAVDVSETTLYKYLCVKDNQNNIGSVQILAATAGSQITIEMITWSAN